MKIETNRLILREYTQDDFSSSTAIAIGMKKAKEYPDEKNEVSYAYKITRKEWEKLSE